MAYATVAEYTTWLRALSTTQPVNLQLDNAEVTAGYQLFLDEATALIESETKRVFTATSATKYFDKHAQDHGKPLLLITPELLTVTSVVNGDGATLDGSVYWAHPRNGARKFAIELTPTGGATWVFTNGYVAVSGTWGVMATPDNFIKRLTMRVAWYIQQSRTFTGQVTTFGDGTRQHEASMPQDIQRDLNRLTYREVV